ncbi:hypothetical protein LINPERPRIM_LOCUS1980 [Linum perenne]
MLLALVLTYIIHAADIHMPLSC